MIIFFDIDDTLLDHSSAEEHAVQQLYARFRLRLSCAKDEFVNLWRLVSEEHMAAFLEGAISFSEQRRRRIRAVFPTVHHDREADQIFQVYLTNYEKSWRIFPDVRPCLRRMAAFRLGILTNGNKHQQRRKLDALGIANCFGVVVTSEEVGVAKPDSRIFQLACRAAACEPNQCVYVGDRLDVDAQAAQRAGWRGIWLNRHLPAVSPPDVTAIPNLELLPPAIAAVAEDEC